MNPQELEQRKQQARNEGYSEEEINAALGTTTPPPEAAPAPVPSGPVTPVAPDPELDRTAEQNTTLATGVGLGAAALGIPAAIAYGIKAIGSGAKNTIGQGMDLAKQGISAANMGSAVSQATAEGIADRELVRQGAMSADEAMQRQLAREKALQALKAPVAPPVAGPVAPPPPQSPASLASRVQQAAASKIANLPPAFGTAGRVVGRALPGVATAVNAADTYNRFSEGDYLGAGLAGLGTVASPFPVVGTAIGLGTAGINAYRDSNKKKKPNQ
jgi:hypothetical protein